MHVTPGTASDEHSVSSSSASGGGGSRGASRTPSPFGHPVSSSVSSGSASASAISAPGHTLPPGAGHAQKGHGSYGATCPLPCSAEGFVSGGGGGGGAEVPLRRPGQAETYSRKVFVGGLPPDIDQGQSLLKACTTLTTTVQVSSHSLYCNKGGNKGGNECSCGIGINFSTFYR